MQELQQLLGTAQLEPKKRFTAYDRVKVIAAIVGVYACGFAFFWYLTHLWESKFATREEISEASVRQWLPEGARSIVMQRRIHRPLLLVEAEVSESDFRNWCQKGSFELHELDPDELPPAKGVKNGLRYRGAHGGVDAIYDRDQGKFILMQYGTWYQFPPDRDALRSY